MVGALRPHVPGYADVVLAELEKPENKLAVKKYIKSVLAGGAKNTFGNVDMTWYSAILKQYGCADAAACQQELGARIREADAKLAYYWLTVLASSALAFILLLTEGPVLRRSAALVLLLFCVVLLVGGVLAPMIEVEAKISHLRMTFLGQPIEFGEQVLYFQSKSVLEVFRTLVTQGKPEMWIVGVLVLMFSVVFPILKILTSVFYLHKPSLLRENQVARFFVLESSKWSMADVMAPAIFMAYVAFNGLIANTMRGQAWNWRYRPTVRNAARLLSVHRLLPGKPVSLEETGARHPGFAGQGIELRSLLWTADAGAGSAHVMWALDVWPRRPRNGLERLLANRAERQPERLFSPTIGRRWATGPNPGRAAALPS